MLLKKFPKKKTKTKDGQIGTIVVMGERGEESRKKYRLAIGRRLGELNTNVSCSAPLFECL